MAFGTGTSNAAAWVKAVQAYSPPGTSVQISWDIRSLKRLLKKVAKLKRRKNRIVSSALKSGLRIVAKAIKQEIPAYTPKALATRRRNNPGRSIARISKMKEAKRAVGVRSGVSKGMRNPVPKGEIFGKVGSNVGMKKRTSRDRPSGGRVGIGRGNLHWYLIGTQPRFTTTGVYTGRMRHPIVISRAWAATRSLALAQLKRNLAAGIQREVNKP